MFKNISQLIKENYKPVLLVFLTLLLMVLISFQSSSRIVNRQMQVIGEETLNTAESNVSATLMESRITFSNIAVTVESMLRSDKDNAEILAFLENMNEYFRADSSPLPDFLKMYAQLRGEFLDGSGWVPPSGYVPEQRIWYTGASDTDEIYFSDPYLDADTGDICISFSKAMCDSSGQTAGVLAIDLNISRIVDYMRQLELGDGSYGLVINNNLQFVGEAHDHLIDQPLADAGSSYREIAAILSAGKPVSAKRIRDTDGTDSVAFFRPVFNGWYLGLIIPRNSYYASVYGLGGVLSILGLVLAVLLSALLLQTRYERMVSIEENRSKSNFLSRMSHEMRTPMNAIIGMTNISKNSTDPEQIKYCLGQINIAANHLLGIINDVLDISKIESGKFSISETDFAVEQMLERVTSVIHPSIADKQLSYRINLDPSIPYAITSDEQRLIQVITNLLSNAVKFTPAHGAIELSLKTTETAGDTCILEFQVRDTGIGIKPEHLATLFQPFQQADNTISRKYGGTGLGLAISRNIVERLGGTIRAESEPGQGSTFAFTIRTRTAPLTPASASEDTENATEEDLTDIFAGKTILMAEDVEINAEILITLLEETGVQIDWAENGRIACEKFEADPTRYDLILMDIHMPELDGYESTKRIRASQTPCGATIPIIAMTANVFQEDINHCLKVGMNDHIGKPLDIPEVITKLKRLL